LLDVVLLLPPCPAPPREVVLAVVAEVPPLAALVFVLPVVFEVPPDPVLLVVVPVEPP
jgi:hypothetical protein